MVRKRVTEKKPLVEDWSFLDDPNVILDEQRKFESFFDLLEQEEVIQQFRKQQEDFFHRYKASLFFMDSLW
jgi:hypothetical protein